MPGRGSSCHRCSLKPTPVRVAVPMLAKPLLTAGGVVDESAAQRSERGRGYATVLPSSERRQTHSQAAVERQ
jgi:hypothetical protein